MSSTRLILVRETELERNRLNCDEIVLAAVHPPAISGVVDAVLGLLTVVRCAVFDDDFGKVGRMEKPMNRKTMVVGLAALFALASVYAVGGDKAEVKGMITGRAGDTMIVKSDAGSTTVVLTADTRTKDNKGLFGLERQEMAETVLIPGLKVDVDGTTDEQGRVVARTVTVDGDDLETAEMVQSGLHPTAEQVAANVQTLEAHKAQIEGHTTQLASQKESIETNQQNIAANKQQIEANIKDI